MESKTTRLLAAVMFTDIVGYTAMMQEDEKKAGRQRDRHRKVLEEKASEFDGQTLHYYGDGAITIFNSAYNAVRCAIQIQRELKKPFLPLRIGIHMGDIVYNINEVYGDAVNIASRLETLSTAGGILISEKVLEEVKNHQDISTVPLGSYRLKNVKVPVAIYGISNRGITIPEKENIEAKRENLSDRIAVLPFVNMSEERGFDFFSDGLTEEIINGLTKLDGLEVTSRTSAFSYKGLNEDIRQIGEKLSVSHVLEGSVRKNKDKIRVTAQLIETGEGFHLWSETYDGHLKDVFEIQDTISQEILSKFQYGVNPARRISSPEKNTLDTNQKAFELYLEGKFQWNGWTIPSVKRALRNFKKTLDIDPEFVNAHTDIANCYIYLGSMGQMSSRLAFEKATDHINSALELNDMSPKAHVSNANLKTFSNFDFEEANKSFKKAISLNQYENLSEPYFYYSIYLNVVGKNDLALYWIEKALQNDPQNIIYNCELARTYYYSQRYSEALEQYKYTLELDSSFLPAIDGKGWVYVALKEYKKAHQVFEIYQNLVSQEQKNIPQLIYMAAKLGMDDIAKHFLNTLQLGDADDNYIATSFDFALVYLGLQKYDDVFFHLQRTIDDKVGRILFINSDPVWDEIKSDKRYKKIISQLGLNGVEKSIRVLSTE